MGTLRESMAEQGFESNDDYDFQVRCLLEGAGNRIRTLAIEGDGERRKTAFATALAHALRIPHVLYHDFLDATPPHSEVILPPSTDEYGRKAAPIEPLDDILSKACALSEAEPTVLILDQLQAADFRDQLRIHGLIRDRRWEVGDAGYQANPRNLMVFLISESPLYHALQRESFRVWVGRVSERRVSPDPAELGLSPDAARLLAALDELLRALDAAPTPGEIGRLVSDLIGRVQTDEDLRNAVFGRCEGVERGRLQDPALVPAMGRVVEALGAYRAAEGAVVGRPESARD